MRALSQRVVEARVDINNVTVGRTGPGLLVLVCAMQHDTDDAARYLARKIAKLRVFEDEKGKMNRSILDVAGSALVVSQFTLAADTTRGNRPGFSTAAAPDEAQRLYQLFAHLLEQEGVPIQTGTFGGDMKVHLVNDGPVTIWIDTAEKP